MVVTARFFLFEPAALVGALMLVLVAAGLMGAGFVGTGFVGRFVRRFVGTGFVGRFMRRFVVFSRGLVLHAGRTARIHVAVTH